MCERGEQMAVSGVVTWVRSSGVPRSFSWCHFDKPKILQSACVKAEDTTHTECVPVA